MHDWASASISYVTACMYCSLSLVLRPPPFFVLQFAFSIMHGRALPLSCIILSTIILNANQRTKNRGGLGTRLLFMRLHVYYQQRDNAFG